MNDESSETEVIKVESERDAIALEDGEIEEEEIPAVAEIIETTLEVGFEEVEVGEAEAVKDGSDMDTCDEVTSKAKKHKHHKKSFHRKRQISSDEISSSDNVKKVRNNNDFNESSPIRDDNHIDSDSYRPLKENSVEKCTWKHDSDNEDFTPSTNVNTRYKSISPVRKEKGFCDEENDMPSQVVEKENSFVGSPVMKEKWGCDSDDDDSKTTNTNAGNNNWCNNDDNKNSWSNKNEGNKNWNDDNKGWKSNDNQNEDKDDDDKRWKSRDDDDKEWKSRDDGNRGYGNRDNNRGWNNRGDSRGNWRNRDEGGGFGNRRGGRNNWGDRNDDRGRGFRNRGRGNWRNRNDDENGGGSRNRGDDWGNNRRDNNSWGNRNDDNNSWNNKGRDNNSWSNKNDENDSWGNKKDDNDSWNNKKDDNDSWSNKKDDNKPKPSWGSPQEENDDWKKPQDDNESGNKVEEVVEKQAWGATSDDEDSCSTTNITSGIKNDSSGPDILEKRRSSFENNMEKDFKKSESHAIVQSADVDNFGKWGDFDSDEECKKPKETTTVSKGKTFNNVEDAPLESNFSKGSPEPAAKWGFDSDDEAGVTKPSTFKPQSSFNDSEDNSGGNKWNSQSDSRPQQARSSFSKWGNDGSDEESKNAPRGKFNDDNNGRGNYNKKSFDQRNNRNEGYNKGDNYNRNDNYNRGDNNNSRGRGGGGAGGKRWPCKYFQSGSCRHGDNCNFIHDSPVKPVVEIPQSEPKIHELCRFYEHQECYNRSTCILMHEEFPCKLFHAGSKMCPSGDSCKYSHAPLNPETRAMLEKYLDEKIDERTDKSASGSINDNSDYKANINVPPFGDERMNEPYLQEPMQRMMYPQRPDMMKMPMRPWNAMMPYGEMPLPPQMDYMQRQRFMFERFPQVMQGRMMQRGFRGMPGPMHDPYNGTPYAIPPMMPVYGNPKGIPDMKERLNGSDPYLDNLAQMVVGPKEQVKRGDDLDDLDEFAIKVETDHKRRSMLSPVKINSPEVPPGAYVPRNSMNAVQPNVRLGSGLPYGGGGGGNETAMMFGGFPPGHPNDPAMMDYINLAAIHYYHNQNESINYDKPWKLIPLDVPCKIPYPLMNIDTQDLPHKYTDPRLKGHPSVLNTATHSSTDNNALLQRDHSHDFTSCNSMSSFTGSQLSSPLTLTPECVDMERQLSSSFPYRSELDSPLFPMSEETFTFLGTDDVAKRVLDRSYLQDPRFKRKKVTATTQAEVE